MKPILFNTEMVRAILEGRKTVTRRVVKPQPTYSPRDGFTWKGGAYGTDLPSTIQGACYNLRCAAPYQVNDILWVREAWRELIRPVGAPKELDYRADRDVRVTGLFKWRPSIHMPKEAARLFLKVTHISVERLCDMQLTDFIAEGITLSRSELKDQNTALFTARERFKELWNSTSGKRGTPEYYSHNWYGNPYVWVIEFEVISKSEALGGSKGG